MVFWTQGPNRRAGELMDSGHNLKGDTVRYTTRKKLRIQSALSTSMRQVLSNNKAKTGFILLLGFLFMGIFGGIMSPYNPNKFLFHKNSPPTLAHLLGTTAYGQDIFSQLMTGAGPTLAVGLSVGVIATLIAITIGVMAGFSSERVRSVIDAVINIFLVIPGILIIMLFGTFLLGISQSLGYIPMIFILSFTGWAFGARTFRAQTLSIAKRDFIFSSLLIGENRMSIIFRQIVRAIFPIIVSNFFFTAIYGVLGLTFVEYLGIGNLLEVNWGTMLYWSISNEAYLTGMWWWILPPGLMISLLMFSFILLNFGIDEISNPSLRKYIKIIDKGATKKGSNS